MGENKRRKTLGCHHHRPDVPRDVWWDILTFLPASSLVRLQAVCKAWRTIIDDPIFSRAQIEKSQNNTILIRTSSSTAPPPLAPYYSVDLDALVPRNGLQTIPATLARPLLDSLPVATCHGLMFEDFEIWNPLFADRLKLLHDPHNNKLVRGLGYDNATDDYKAVVIDCGRHQNRAPQLAFRTYVYSLRSDSWRRVGDCPCGNWGIEDRPGLFLSGALHWMSCDFVGYDDDYDYGDVVVDDVVEIIALDLETEKFRKLQMPPFEEVRRRRKGRKLDVLDGCLVVTGFCKVGNCSFELDAWVLERGGEWVQLFSLSHSSRFSFDDHQIGSSVRPVGYIMKNKRHILMEDCGRFYLVDAEIGKLKRVRFSVLDVQYLCAQPFQESLFRPRDICGVVSGQQRKKMSSREKKSKTKRRMMEKYTTDFCFCVSDF